ncbi:MAG: hypothetical protein HRT87_09435 [Legionellales bacterium]|nr:hypothetical protein [Legionellales bacterium]
MIKNNITRDDLFYSLYMVNSLQYFQDEINTELLIKLTDVCHKENSLLTKHELLVCFELSARLILDCKIKEIRFMYVSEDYEGQFGSPKSFIKEAFSKQYSDIETNYKKYAEHVFNDSHYYFDVFGETHVFRRPWGKSYGEFKKYKFQ